MTEYERAVEIIAHKIALSYDPIRGFLYDYRNIAESILTTDGIEIRADDQSAPAIKYVGDRKTLAIETQSDMFRPDSEGKHFVKVIPKGR